MHFPSDFRKYRYCILLCSLTALAIHPFTSTTVERWKFIAENAKIVNEPVNNRSYRRMSKKMVWRCVEIDSFWNTMPRHGDDWQGKVTRSVFTHSRMNTIMWERVSLKWDEGEMDNLSRCSSKIFTAGRDKLFTHRDHYLYWLRMALMSHEKRIDETFFIVSNVNQRI